MHEVLDGATTGSLAVVSTPIGNLGDVTYRAIETLKSSGVVLAEDTRRTRRLFSRYGVSTRLESYHDHNKERVTPGIVRRLGEGVDFALVSDAGTPCVSDPGFYLVRAALSAGFSVTAVPGASSVLAALVVSGFPTDAFVFEGFLPRKPGALSRTLDSLVDRRQTSIFFVGSHQLPKVLAATAERIPDREIVVARELTKLHETVTRGTAADVCGRLGAKAPKGEIVLMVKGRSKKGP